MLPFGDVSLYSFLLDPKQSKELNRRESAIIIECVLMSRLFVNIYLIEKLSSELQISHRNSFAKLDKIFRNEQLIQICS